jgi:hypothetical protein
MPFFRKKPYIVEAKRFAPPETPQTLLAWINTYQSINRRPYAYQAPDGDIIIPVVGQTVMRAKPGSWIVKGALDEFCPFDAPGFVHLFEPVEDVKDWDVIVAEADRLGLDH